MYKLIFHSRRYHSFIYLETIECLKPAWPPRAERVSELQSNAINISLAVLKAATQEYHSSTIRKPTAAS